jgi:death-on-curing protein
MTRPEPRWLGRLAIDEAHFRQIRDHGGAYGLRDENALESALARPRPRWEYDEAASTHELAAAYAFGLVTNHPYVDGNKRIGLVAMAAFLDLNGYELTASNAEAASMILSLAAGELSEADVSGWIEQHFRRA